MESVALRYATSLFEIAKEENAIERYEADLHLVKDVLTKDEDVLSYALFPQVAKDFFEYREAQQTKVDQSIADKENGAYPV